MCFCEMDIKKQLQVFYLTATWVIPKYTALIGYDKGLKLHKKWLY